MPPGRGGSAANWGRLALQFAACFFFGASRPGPERRVEKKGSLMIKVLFTIENWPVLFICLAMIASAVIDWWKFKVPNWLTFPVILGGWLLGLLHNLGLQPDAGVGGIGSSLAGTAMGFALLVPFYAIGGMGAGDVKMSMGFGSWMGAFYGLDNSCLVHITLGFCVAAIVGGVLGLIMIAIRRNYRENVAHTRAILMDLVVTRSVKTMAERAHERRPRWHRLPYGVPLCIGFLTYLWFAGIPMPGAGSAEKAAVAHTRLTSDIAELAALGSFPPDAAPSPTSPTLRTVDSFDTTRTVEVTVPPRSK